MQKKTKMNSVQKKGIYIISMKKSYYFFISAFRYDDFKRWWVPQIFIRENNKEFFPLNQDKKVYKLTLISSMEFTTVLRLL